MKTDTQNSVAGTSQNLVPQSKGNSSVRAKDAPIERPTQSSPDDSDVMTGKDSVDVARARDVYTRTGDATGPGTSGRVTTADHATKLVDILNDKIQQEPRKALEAQAKDMSPNLAELLRS